MGHASIFGCHCEERSDEAISLRSQAHMANVRLLRRRPLRYARGAAPRNDIFGCGSAALWLSAFCLLLLPLALCGCAHAPHVVDHEVGVAHEGHQARLFDYRGAIHIHSTYSDGGGDIPLIARAASQAGVDFAVITDHNTLQGLSEEGWYGSVLVLVGAEMSTTGGHLLTLNCNELPQRKESQLAINDVKSQDGLTFLAHPLRTKRPWQDWDVQEFTGMEAYSLSGDYFDEPWPSKVRSLLLMTFSTDFALRLMQDNPRDTLARWDELLRTAKVVGIAGVDAHSNLKLTRWVHLRLPKYRALLGAVSTHALTTSPLTGNLPEDKQLIYDALKSGHCYIAFDNIRQAKGFSFVLLDRAGRIILMGDEVSFRPGLVFQISTPSSGAKIRLLKDGEPFMERAASSISGQITQPGVYRAEVYLKDHIWIISNPIYVRPASPALE